MPTFKVNSNYKKALNTNVNGTKYLVDAVIKYKKILAGFSFHPPLTYTFQKKKIKETFKPNPVSKYGKTKLAAENYFRKKLKRQI